MGNKIVSTDLDTVDTDRTLLQNPTLAEKIVIRSGTSAVDCQEGYITFHNYTLH